MQAATQLPTTPPLSGSDLVAKTNAALSAIGTDFAGAVDPAGLAWACASWADTGNMLLKRRNVANNAWVTLGPLFDFHYTRGNILGPVALDPGGSPAGSIIERGANGNGEYIRWADGTQICINNRFSFSNRAAGMFGELFASSDLQWTFPAPFTDRCAFGGFAYEGAGATWGWVGLGSGASNLTTSAYFRVIGWQSQSAGGYVSLAAKGRWS